MPRPSRRRLTASEFAELLPLLTRMTRMTPERIEMARLAIVEGRSMPSVGVQYGCTKQSVANAVETLWREVKHYRESQCFASKFVLNAKVILPPGWEQVTLIAPSHLIEKFRYELILETSPAIATEAASKIQASNRNSGAKLLTN